MIFTPRDGCRPFIEFFYDGKVYSTCAEYEKLVQYTRSASSSVVWKDINIKVDLITDLQLVISHARSTIGSKVLSQAKLTPIRITSMQFNLFFETIHQEGNQKVTFFLKELDDIDELDRFPHDLKIEINFAIGYSESTLSSAAFEEASQNEILLLTKPECIFSCESEYDEFKEIYSLTEVASKPKQKPPTRPPPPSLPLHST